MLARWDLWHGVSSRLVMVNTCLDDEMDWGIDLVECNLAFHLTLFYTRRRLKSTFHGYKSSSHVDLIFVVRLSTVPFLRVMPIRWKLHEVMSRRRIRNKDLAEALDITENSVYRLRKAEDMPRLTPQRLEGICEVLNCQPGELLEWVAEDKPLYGYMRRQESLSNDASEAAAASNAVILQHAQATPRAVSMVTLQRLTQYYQPILALSWQGFAEYGPGAVVFTDLATGPKLAFVEQQNLTDQHCIGAIEQNNPEVSAVVLYYKDADYSRTDYGVLTLIGPKSPPECFALSYKA